MIKVSQRLPRWLSGKESTCLCKGHRRLGFNPWVGKIPWRKKWQPTLVFLPGEFHGQRSLVGYSSWGGKDSDMTNTFQRVYILTVTRPKWRQTKSSNEQSGRSGEYGWCGLVKSKGRVGCGYLEKNKLLLFCQHAGM